MTVYRPMSGWGHARLPDAAEALLGARHGDLYVVAPSKAAGERALAAAGIDWPARRLEPATGLASNALTVAGLLAEVGVVVTRSHSTESPVLRLLARDRAAVVAVLRDVRTTEDAAGYVPGYVAEPIPDGVE